jgi:Protein of unknown function (DUF3795)
MISTERINLVAPCGIDCGICELYGCRGDARLFSSLTLKGIPTEKIPCDGCRSIEGNCPFIKEQCETYKCVAEKKVEYCFECSDFPCAKLHPSSKRAEILPHNMKVFNLCTMKRDGAEAFVEKSSEFKRRYYAGIMEIGNGPQLDD